MPVDEQVTVNNLPPREIEIIETGPQVHWLRRVQVRTPEGHTPTIVIRGVSYLRPGATFTPATALELEERTASRNRRRSSTFASS